MTVTSREIVERMLRAGREMDIEAFVGLMAPDGCIEWPYRPAGVPARLQGRAEIREFLTGSAKAFIRFDEYRDVVVHETTDTEVVIVEYEVHGTVIATGTPFRQTVIAVFRVRDGQVLTYRDYVNPLPLAEALASHEQALPKTR
jgi:ketosteroid isomerase-like protein